MTRAWLILGAAAACREPARVAPTPVPPPPPPIVVEPAPAPVPLARLPDDVRPLAEALTLTLDPAADHLAGQATIELELAHPTTAFYLHGRGLAVRAATLDGHPATYTQVDDTGVARVTLAAPASGHVTLALDYTAPYDPSLVGIYKVHTSAGDAVFSKFEAIYARRAFPCFDEPRFKIPYDVAIVAPAGATAIANGEPTAATATTHRFARTPPLPTYLLAFAVGPFDVVAGPPGTPRLDGVAVRGRGGELAFALGEARAVVDAQARYFGIPYPYAPKLALVAVPDFQSGAMENAAAITFRDSALLVDARTSSVAQRATVSGVVAHEIAHQWFGDLVTMPWWDDLWLNEGFATFLATRTLRDLRPELEPDLAALADTEAVMAADSLASARRIRQPIASTHDITNAFDGITYDKGAAVLAMLEHYLGPDAFQRGVHAYLADHAHGNATTAALVAALAAASGRDVAPIAASFLDRPGVPLVTVTPTCEGGRGRATLAQARWHPLGAALDDAGPWSVPVCLRTAADARATPVETCTLLTAATQTIDLPACAAWVMPNAGATGYYRFALAPAELAKLRVAPLSTVERLALAYDLAAAFDSGAIAGGDVLAALDVMARDAHGAVAAVPLGVYAFVDADVLADEPRARAALRAHVAALYAPVVRALGWTAPRDEPAWRRAFRARLYATLALELDDRALLAAGAARGRAYLGLDGDRGLHPDAVEPDCAGVALAALARTGGAASFDALLARFAASDDAVLRGKLLGALANVREPALVARALDLALDPRLRATERIVPVARLLGSTTTRDAALAWLAAHFDAYVALLPDRYAGYLPGATALCDDAHAQTLAAIFAPRIEHLTGGPRNLAHALEAAQQCRARVDAQRASVLAFARAVR